MRRPYFFPGCVPKCHQNPLKFRFQREVFHFTLLSKYDFISNEICEELMIRIYRLTFVVLSGKSYRRLEVSFHCLLFSFLFNFYFCHCLFFSFFFSYRAYMNITYVSVTNLQRTRYPLVINERFMFYHINIES